MRSGMIAWVLLVLAAGASGQSPIDGKWAFAMNSPMGSVTADVELKAEDGKLTGGFDLGGGRVLSIENGTVDGDTLSFTITREGRMTYEMKGKVSGDKITGVAAAMGATVDWEMTRAK